MAAGTCRFCGCTDAAACGEGCSWVDETQELCSVCQPAAHAAAVFLEVLARMPRPLRAAEGVDDRFDRLRMADQQMLVMTCRLAIESALGLFDDGVGAMLEMSRLGDYLVDQFPDRVSTASGAPSPVELAIALLGDRATVTQERDLAIEGLDAPCPDCDALKRAEDTLAAILAWVDEDDAKPDVLRNIPFITKKHLRALLNSTSRPRIVGP